jgi:nitrate/nitrite transport system ATP-binding protein
VKALLEACEYCDDLRNREEILTLLTKEQYVGSAPQYTRPGFIDPYDRGTGEVPQQISRFNQFYVDKSNYPDQTEGLWLMTQLARWGIVPFPKNWVNILDRVRRIDLFGEAARELGLVDIGHDRGPIRMFDGTVFDPNNPLEYLNSLEIKRQIRVQEVDIDAVATPVA